ncbi:alpha/beta fold hydrolase [Actinomycetospora sp. CA-084318]|uniref:alpha/beta fold hydrolase n=1 Tax=Actinomycetospora sp. CA-084318 TaxID=3239892 RepID=UPI003D97F729
MEPASQRFSSTAVWPNMNDLELTTRYIDVVGWRTRVLEVGEGRPLVLMHGSGGHLEAYLRNLRALSEHFRVIAYDFPGHGYTSLATEDLELPTYVEHLLALLDTLGIDKASLDGESLGGWVAIKFAARHPERVERIVLNTPGGTMARPEVMRRIRSLSQEAADDPTPERIRRRLEWLMASPSSVTDELVDLRRGVYSRPGFARSMSHILCLQDPEIRRRNLITDDELAAVEAPALVLWTTHDPSGPAQAGKEMASKIRGAEFALIEDAGHWPQWEQTEKFDSLMLEFLGAVPVSA